MITIVTPYGRCDTTAAAIRVAEYAVATGRDVKIASVGTHVGSVNPNWDNKVVRIRDPICLGKLVYKNDAVINFDCCPSRYKAITLGDTDDDRPRHIAVPDWHALLPNGFLGLADYDHIVCPAASCRHAVSKYLWGKSEADGKRRKVPVSCVQWDAGITPTVRDGSVAEGVTRVCVYCDASAMDLCGPFTVRLVDELLALHSKLAVTMVYARSWAKRDKMSLRKSAETWEGRLRLFPIGSLFELRDVFYMSDWVLFPAVRSTFGSPVMEAAACGAAVICNDVEPFSSLVSASRGILVPCDVYRDYKWRLPVAGPQLANWIHACQPAFVNNRKLLTMQREGSDLLSATKAFNAAWESVLK